MMERAAGHERHVTFPVVSDTLKLGNRGPTKRTYDCFLGLKFSTRTRRRMRPCGPWEFRLVVTSTEQLTQGCALVR